MLAADCDVTVIEQSSQLGGKLRSSELAGIRIDEGAESFLVRRPEAVELAADLGLTVIHPNTTSASVLIRDTLRPLPRGTLLGVPGDLAALRASRVLTAPQLARVLADRVLPGSPLESDVAVGDVVGRRLGRAVVDRLVDPLLGGVYAGRADQISLAMAIPSLFAAMQSERSLVAAARGLVPAGSSHPGPVFGSVSGGADALTDALVSRVRAAGGSIALGSAVTAVVRKGDGWLVSFGSRTIECDALVLACPAAPTSRLLRDIAPGPARQLAGVEYASVAIVNLVYRASDVQLPAGSGYLVADPARVVKAVTFVSSKWSIEGDGEQVVVRASVGRHDDVAALALTDVELVARVHAEVAPVAAVAAEPIASQVTRWGGALPQYAPGHLGLVGAVRSGLPERIAVVGAAYDGVGIPACIWSGRAGAAEVLRQLTHERGGKQAEGA